LILSWLRKNPAGGRLVVKFGLALPAGLIVGLLLGWLCDSFALSRNYAAAGAGLAAVVAAKLSDRVSARLRIPEPEA
jgi:hypothetical protein